MGEKLGISQGYVAQIENESVNASPRVTQKILELSGQSRAEIESALKKAAEKESDFGDWVQERRAKLGLSRQELADKAGIPYITLYFIEKHETESPRQATIDAIKKVLGELPKDVQTEVVDSAQGGFGEYQGPFPFKEWESSIDDKTPGIYVFYDVSNRPVYIGESKDIKRRIYEHDREFWFKPPVVHKVAYLVVKDDDIRARLEAAMIALVGEHAILNKQHTRREAE